VAPLKSGFTFIGWLVYEYAKIRVHSLATSIEKCGIVLGVKTDAVFAHMDVFPESIGEFRITTTKTFDDIGHITKVMEFKTPAGTLSFITGQTELVCDQYAPMSATKDILGDFVCEPKLPSAIECVDEFDPDEVTRTIRSVDKPLLIKALVPGAGKTTSAINYAKCSLECIETGPRFQGTYCNHNASTLGYVNCRRRNRSYRRIHQ